MIRTLLEEFILIKRVLKQFWSFSLLIFFSVALAAALNSFGIVFILPIMQVVVTGKVEGRFAEFLNPILVHFSKDNIFPFLCSIFLMLIFLKFIATFGSSCLKNMFCWKMRLDWSCKVFSNYTKSEITFITDQKQGKLISNIISELQRASICVQKALALLSDSIMVLILYTTSLYVNVALTVCMSAIFLTMVIIIFPLRIYVKHFGKKRIEAQADATSTLAESISAIKQIKVFGLENYFQNFFFKKISKLRKIEILLFIFRDIPSYISELIVSFIIIILLGYFYYFSLVDLKDMLPSLAVLALLGMRMMQAVMQMSGSIVQISATLPSLRLAMDLAEHHVKTERLESGISFDKIKSDLRFENISFSYDGKTNILNNAKLIFRKGKMTAVIGESGSGKSTIVNLLTGIYRPQNGRILINNEDISRWKLSEWRKKIGYVTQDSQLFNMSIAENIAIGKQWKIATKQEIEDAAKRAHAHQFIMEFPNGYGTIVGDRGMRLSGGQRQRIAIARALIRKPELLIFDEATSALDNESEKQIQKAIEEAAQSKTVIVIAHRLSTIENANYVIDLNKFKK